jgi:hypothetical protein
MECLVLTSVLSLLVLQVVSLRREYLARQEELGYAEDVHYPQMLLLRPLY